MGFAPGPRDNSAAAPRRKPDYCLNVGITWPGLVALEHKRTRPERYPSSHSAPSSKEPRSARSWLAIPAPARPQNWVGGFGEGHDHVLVTLHAISPVAMQSYSDRVSAWFAEGDAFRESGARTGWR